MNVESKINIKEMADLVDIRKTIPTKDVQR